MRRLLPLFLAMVIFIASAGIPVLASDTSDALWSGIVRITNNSTAATIVSTNFTLNTPIMVANGYMNSSANNTALTIGGADVAYMPGYLNNPWCVYAGSMGASTIIDGQLYTGGTTDMAGKLRYFPAAGGMTVPDTITEPAANFTMTFRGLVDTDSGSGKYIVSKGTAVEIITGWQGSGNITANINTVTVAQATVDQDRNVGNATIFRVGERFNAFAASDIISLTYGLRKSAAPTGTLYVVVRKVSDDSVIGILGSLDVSTLTAAYVEHTFTNVVNNAAPQDIRIQVEYAGGDAGNYVQVETKAGGSTYAGGVFTYYDVGYTDDAAEDMLFSITSRGVGCNLSAVPSSEATVVIQADSVNVWLTVDTATTHYGSSNATVVAINNVATIWTFISAYSMPYMQYAEIKVGGTQKGYWDWEYGATFTDASGSGNTATPSYRTTSSDADVSAELVSFAPITEAEAPEYTVDDPPDFVTANITVSGGFTDNTTIATAPGVAVISAVTTASGTPVPFILYLLSGIGLVALSFCVSFLMRSGGSSSLVIKLVVILGSLGILIAINILDDWTMYLFAMLGIGIAFIASNRQFEGTGNTGNNFLGFLIMAWLGLMVVNRMLEGVLLTSADKTSMNDFLIFQPWNVANWFVLPVPSVRFLTVGLPALMQWDYTAFGGNAQIFTYMMYSISGVVAFMFFTVAMGAAANMFFRSR